MDKKTYNVEFYGMNFEIKLFTGNYTNGRPAIVAETVDGEPFCDLTVNLPETCIPDEGYAFIDTNNAPFALNLIVENNLGDFTGINGTSGWCRYPLIKLNLDELTKAATQL